MFDGDDSGAIVIDNSGGGDGGGGGSDVQDDLENQGGDDAAGGGADDDQHQDGDSQYADDDRGSGRSAAPQDVRKAVRAIAEANPDFAKQFPKFEKQITGALFTRQQVDQLGGMRQITETLDRIDSIGGLDAVEEISEQNEQLRGLETGLERGDPAVIEGWAKDFPDGFKRSVLPMFEALEKLDEEASESVGSYIIAKMFEKFGAFAGMTELGRALGALKDDDPAKKEAVGHFNSIAKFLKSTRELGGKAKSDPYSARRIELDERERNLNDTAAKNFRATVRGEVNTSVSREINTELRRVLSNMRVFRVEARTADRMRKEINAELQRLVAGEPEYSRRYSEVMGSGNRERAINFVTKAAMKHIAKAVKTVVPDYNLKPVGRPGSGGPRRRAAGAAGGSGGSGGGRSNEVKGVPKTGDVDFSRTPMALFLSTKKTHGKAFLKNGSVAVW